MIPSCWLRRISFLCLTIWVSPTLDVHFCLDFPLCFCLFLVIHVWLLFLFSPENGVCTVFGDPHYRSFDGRLFNFQGRCKYLLAADCSTNDFRVRVRNDGRNTKSFSWTKTVFLTLGKHSITLLQDYVVRVNRETITVPYSVDSVFRIYRDSYNVIVETNIGKIIWREHSLEQFVAY